MRTRNLFITIPCIILFAIALVSLAVNSSDDARAGPPAASQVTPLQNGASIIESRCARCHTAQGLEQTRKTRTEWDNILAQMERMGTPISDAEKTILLDYLTSNDEP